MSPLIAALYTLCILFLTTFSIFVLAKNPMGRLNRYFAALCLALLGWVGSLFAFSLQTSPSELLWIGRFNFASVAFAVTLTYLFTREVAGKKPNGSEPWLWIETFVLGAVSLLTSAVDTSEHVSNGLHTTTYGPVFLIYIAHILVYIGSALYVCWRPGIRVSLETRSQLSLIGGGVLTTVAIALVTNALLPYLAGDFRFIHIGTISTIIFIAATGYAVFVYHLFDIHVVIRATLVYGGLIALALEFYHASIGFLAHLLPLGDATERNFAATTLTLVVYSFTQNSVQAWLERIVRRVISGPHKV